MKSITQLLFVHSLILIILTGFTTVTCDFQCITLEETTKCPLETNLLSFWVYDSDRANAPYELTYDNIEKAPLYPDKPIIFISHGLTGSKDKSPNPEIRPFYLALNYTVVSLDWSRLAENIRCYVETAHNVKFLGKCLAEMVDKILKIRRDISCELIRFLGLSLGAHVVGNGGRNVKSCKVPRITALDAAKPLFDDDNDLSPYRINKNDGKFVDGYHTNCDVLGLTEPYADVDVYLNGCSRQPGCGFIDFPCSHVRSAEFFGWSINKDVCFKAHKCNSFRREWSGAKVCKTVTVDKWDRVGEYIDHSLNGMFAANSSDEPPYFPYSKNYTC